MPENHSKPLFLHKIDDEIKTKNVSFKNLDDKVLVIHPDEVDEDKSTIIGYVDVSQKKFKDNQKYCIRLGLGDDEAYFDVMRKAQGKVIGYLPVDAGENDIYIAVTKDSAPIILIIILLAVAAAIIGTAVMVLKPPAASDVSAASGSEIMLADGEPFDGNVDNGQVESAEETNYIEIPGYSDIYVSKGSTVDLANPEGNGVYFKYTITENGNAIYESDYIKPGEKIAWNATDYISGAGEHSLIFEVSTISVETQQPCNGATFAVTAYVS